MRRRKRRERSVNALQLAAELGISRSEVYRLVALGVLIRTGPGRHPVARNIKRYEFYQAHRPGPGGSYWPQSFDVGRLWLAGL